MRLVRAAVAAVVFLGPASIASAEAPKVQDSGVAEVVSAEVAVTPESVSVAQKSSPVAQEPASVVQESRSATQEPTPVAPSVSSGKPLAFKQDNSEQLPSIGYVGGMLFLFALVVVGIAALLRKKLVAQGKIPDSLGKKIIIQDRKLLHGGHYVYQLEVDGKSLACVIGPQQSSLCALNTVELKTDDQ